MANADHVAKLHAGLRAWMEWRREHRRGRKRIDPDLSGALLDGARLKGFDLRRANLFAARLRGADLRGADLSYAQLSKADLSAARVARAEIRFAILSGAKLIDTDLRGADLRGTSLRFGDLTRADLRGAILRHASLAGATLTDARLSGAEIFGAGIWGIEGEPAEQSGLILAANDRPPAITADDLDAAQLLFVLMDNPKIAEILDATSSRTVLILGRFTERRKAVLDAIRKRLLERNFVPMLFDFAKPRARDLTETVASLANMSYCRKLWIADVRRAAYPSL